MIYVTTLPGSIIDTTLRLESRMTSWGRGPRVTIRHSDLFDNRIPTYALELTFWAPNIADHIEQGGDWTKIPNLMTILTTKTSKCIWVNDVELRKETTTKDARPFGKLYTGDIITVYRSKDSYLKFRCEFSVGESAETRPESERGFIIQHAKQLSGDLAVDGKGIHYKTIQGITTNQESESNSASVKGGTEKTDSGNSEEHKKSPN